MRSRSARDGRARRALLGWAVMAVVAGAGALVVMLTSSAPAQPEDGVEADLALGGELYSAWCVHCHGSSGQGIVGEGVRAGPRLDHLEVAYQDLLLRTGRMPIIEPRVGIIADPGFTDLERESLVAWMADAFDLPGEIPQVAAGDPGSGAELYATHCAACHGGGGVGGVSGGGATVRAVRDLDPVAIVEAIRVGPFAMPRFSEAHLSDEDAADIASFVTVMSEDTRSPLGMRETHRVTIGLLVLPLLIGVVGGVFMAAHAGTKRGQ